MRFLDVFRPQAGGETVDRVVRELHALLEIVEREHREHGPEDLFARDRHVRLHAVEHGGFDVVALAVGFRRLAASDKLCAFVHALLDVGENGLLLFFGDERTEARVLIEGIAGRHFLRALSQLLDHLRMHRFLNQETRSGGAHFALAVEDPRLRPAHGSFQVGVGEYDVGTLAAELHGDALVRRGGHFHDLPAHLRRSRKGDLVDVGMSHERGSSSGAAARHHVERSRRQSRLERDLGKEQGRERGLRRRLQDNRAPRREGRGKLPTRDVEREIPGHDRADDADRLAERVGQEGAFDGQRVADNLVRPPRVVAQRVDRHPDLDLRLEQRLAVLSRLEPGDFIEPRFQQIP